MNLPNKKYQIIYADPPWRYEDNSATPNRRIERHYSTMLLDEIKKLEVPSDKDAILYLWSSAPKLEEALEVMNAWGFKYRSNMVWDKEVIGMGYWFRIQHELLLVGVKGKIIHTPDKHMRIGSVYRSRRREHSKKPNTIRNLIFQWYPKENKLELFARQRYEGWDAWGDELPNTTQKILGSE